MKLLSALVLAVSMAMLGAARGQATTNWIDDPLPEALNGRAAELMSVLRPNDTEAALANMRLMPDGFGHNAEFYIFRVETDCDADQCMTIIAKINDKSIRPELTLIAGRAVLFTDVEETRWGTPGWWPFIIFQGTKNAALAVTRRGEQWVIAACGQCQSLVQARPSKRPDGETVLKAPIPYPQTYDEFRQALDLKR